MHLRPLRFGLAAVALLVLTGCSPSERAADPDQQGPGRPVATTSVDELISVQRQRIDQYDRQLMELLQRRKAASEAIQRARTAAGGGRVDQAREEKIIAGYRDALGEPGAEIARAMLQAFRGKTTR